MSSWAEVEAQVLKPATPQPLNTKSWDWVDSHVDAAQEKKAEREIRAGTWPKENMPGGSLDRASLGVSPAVVGEPANRGRKDRTKKEMKKEKKGKPRNYSQRGFEEEEFDTDSYRERRQAKAAKKAEKERERLEALAESGPVPILIPQFISVANLAAAMNVKLDIFLDQLLELGFDGVGKDNILTGETAALVAQEYGFEPTVDTGDDEDLKPRPPPEDPSSLPPRPPVVTIMGHVDHGKTTLLDWLRKSSIVAKEHGGITQHIGAFSVKMSTGKQITFLDTPGHAAFLSMRQRGANVTDLVVLVVAADDSVKPQTLEALKHARAAKVPIIVAINKIDKESANIERCKSDLAAHGVEIEDYGGDVQVVCVSGKTGLGMDDFEENILLLSDMLDIRAEPDGMAEGWVLESSIKPMGRVATVLVKRGTLRPGDYIVAGIVHAKIRSLRNEAGVEIDKATPGTAVEILGWKDDDPPAAGDQVLQAPDEGRAKAAAHYRIEQKEREEVIGQMSQAEQERREHDRLRAIAKKAELEAGPKGGRGYKVSGKGRAEYSAVAEDGVEEEDGTKIVNYLVRGDVHGSVEAVCGSIMELGSNEVRPRILQSGTGQITESDVEHAQISRASIINFNNPISGQIKRMANDAGVTIMDHNVIYHLAEEVREKLSELLAPIITSKVVGEVEVLKVFKINVKGREYVNIAGCRVRNGQVKFNSKCRVMRNNEPVFEGPIDTLKQGKKEVEEMRKGTECGISFPNWDEFKEGDNIQIIEEVIEKRHL
ncbi:hypothetical protein B0H63DRAFT_394985 [Podospora didyma]|uniref:Translation initiation factor IF-2, mitochondrial n=1 Tax=Podospora didyma TaxID=330526 RepID=A0AAE0NPD0_9PEZI|nr:hypothetical protein B0H63DRAFT_394985 [Podospora didyma]